MFRRIRTFQTLASSETLDIRRVQTFSDSQVFGSVVSAYLNLRTPFYSILHMQMYITNLHKYPSLHMQMCKTNFHYTRIYIANLHILMCIHYRHYPSPPSLLFQPQPTLPYRYGWWTEPTTSKAGWKFSITTYGGPSAMTGGACQRPLWPVASWASKAAGEALIWTTHTNRDTIAGEPF